ncbi:FMN-binding protein [Celerinatantimonas sp. YJH-8]|uniref:FMN-binding protein n=1 Tax=Celerinatantimonas sp. YJH-8 TaxID=3228714 RepID=UPI0038C4AC9B
MTYSAKLLCAVLSTTLLLSGCFDHNPKEDAKIQALRDKISGRHENENKTVKRDPQRVLAETAGLSVQGNLSDTLKARITTQWVNLDNDSLITDDSAIAKYQQLSQQGLIQPHALDPKANLAGLKEQEKIAKVYLVKAASGDYSEIVLPIRGMGYFDMLYGYLALDLHTLKITRIGFYQNAETPALGGQVMTNQQWAAKFAGKSIFKSGQPDFRLTKGGEQQDDYSVDGISGATHTSRGVQNLINYWCGNQGYGPLLTLLQYQYTKQ